METIEQLEALILSRSNRVQDGLDIFQDNIGKIGQVIGKDPTYVYEVLCSSFNNFMDSYNNATSKNTELLNTYISKLDRILEVLTEVARNIEKIDNAENTESLDVRADVDASMERIAENVEKGDISIVATTVESSNLMTMGLIGIGTYLLLKKLVHMGDITSAAIGAVVAYMMTKE